MERTGEVLGQRGSEPGPENGPVPDGLLDRALHCPYLRAAVLMHKIRNVPFEDAISEVALAMSKDIEMKNNQLIQMEVDKRPLLVLGYQAMAESIHDLVDEVLDDNTAIEAGERTEGFAAGMESMASRVKAILLRLERIGSTP